MNLLFYQSSEHGCKKIYKHKRVCVQLFLTSSVNTRMQQQSVSNLLSSVAESKEIQRGRLNPRKLKKKEEKFRAVEKMDSILLCICSTRRYRCCKNKREAQEAQQFQTLYFRRTVAFFFVVGHVTLGVSC